MFKIRLITFNQKIVKGFAFLGPLGNLLTPQLIAPSFRTYYFLLLTMPFFFFSLKYNQIKHFLFFSFFFLYSLLSLFFISTSFTATEEVPIFRLSLLLSHFIFVLGATNCIKNIDFLLQLVRIYLYSNFISLIIGYLFFFGYYLNLWSFQLIEKFSILAQIGYGFLRFSPGSYPNEYGVTMSFTLSIITLVLLDRDLRQKFKSWKLYLVYVLGLGALILTTTRAAYLSYAFCLFYISLRTGQVFKTFFKTIAIFGVFVAIFFLFQMNILNILALAFNLKKWEDGSLGERFSFWSVAKENWMKNPWWGDGFSTYTHLHNVYFQFLCELGIVGVCLFLSGIVLTIVEKRYFLFKKGISIDLDDKLIQEMIRLGFLHILWFAMSNHNLNHHLTWFVFLLYFSYQKLQQTRTVALVS